VIRDRDSALAPTARWRHIDLKLCPIDSKCQRPVALEHLVNLERSTIQSDAAHAIGNPHGQRERAVNRTRLELRPKLDIVVTDDGGARAGRRGLGVDHPSRQQQRQSNGERTHH